MPIEEVDGESVWYVWKYTENILDWVRSTPPTYNEDMNVNVG